MAEARITTNATLRQALKRLSCQDKVVRTLFEQNGLPNLRRRPQGFRALLFAIVSQQVSTASATAIMQRLTAAGLTTETAILAASEPQLVAAGLSRQKRRYVRALAEARVDWPGLRQRSTAAVVEELTAIVGIGPWTAEIYCLFSLGHADAFAPGDLALQVITQELYDLPTRPSEAELRAFSNRWSPYRGAAARLLWDEYVRRQHTTDS